MYCLTTRYFSRYYWSLIKLCHFDHSFYFSITYICLDRCQAGYTQVKNHQWEFCAKYHDDCTSKQDASQKCRNENAYLGTPRDNRETYLLSNMAGGEDIQIGLNDQQQDGQWVRDNGEHNYIVMSFVKGLQSFNTWTYQLLLIKTLVDYKAPTSICIFISCI